MATTPIRRNGQIEQIGPNEFRVDNERGTVLTLKKKDWGWEVLGDNVRARVAWRGRPGVHAFRTLKEVEQKYKAFRGIGALLKENPKAVTAYGVVSGRDNRGQKWIQEHYEAASGDARVRAAQLRKLGLKVSVVPMGPQITSSGVVRMTMVDVRGVDPDQDVPAPDRVERNARRSNFGEGNLFNFHGTYTTKADAVKKEQATPGAFIKTVWFKSGPRYAVVTKRAENRSRRNAIKFNRWQQTGVHPYPRTLKVGKLTVMESAKGRFKVFLQSGSSSPTLKSQRAVLAWIKKYGSQNPRKRNYVTITGERTPETESKMLKAAADLIRTAGWDAMAREFEQEPGKRKRIASFISRDISKRWGTAKGLKAYEYLISVAKWLERKNPVSEAEYRKLWAKYRPYFRHLSSKSAPGGGRRKKRNSIVDEIRPGDRVTILTPHGQQRSGRAVMRSSSGGWVLNLGGPHGTPGIATNENVVKVTKRKNGRRKNNADTDYFRIALAKKFPGKKVEELTTAQLSKVMQEAQAMKLEKDHPHGKSNPVRKVPGGWRAIGPRGRMSQVFSSRRDAELYAESFRNPPKQLTAKQARELGAEAFRKGLKRVPAHDPTLMQRLQPGLVGTNRAALAGWLRGWDKANLSQPNPVCGKNIGGHPCSRKPGHKGPHLPQGATLRPKSRLPRGWQGKRRRNYWTETIKEGSRHAVISANEASGPYSIRLYVNNGETATLLYKKAKTLAGARKIANKMLEPYRTGNPRRRNYEDATELYTKFHGRGPKRVTDTALPVADYGDHPELGQLGRLVSLTIGDEGAEKPWKKKIQWKGDESPDLAAEPGGQQLYIVGGVQDLDSSLDSLPIDIDKDMLDLGFAYQVEYFSQKKFDNFQPVTYFHDLGEETGDQPRVVYDRTKKRIHLVGGAYEVKPEGIVN